MRWISNLSDMVETFIVPGVFYCITVTEYWTSYPVFQVSLWQSERVGRTASLLAFPWDKREPVERSVTDQVRLPVHLLQNYMALVYAYWKYNGFLKLFNKWFLPLSVSEILWLCHFNASSLHNDSLEEEIVYRRADSYCFGVMFAYGQKIWEVS